MTSVLDNTHDATKEEEHDPQFEPVIHLTEQVETKTFEEDEAVVFKMRAKLFRFDMNENAWKERGTGDVRLLQHKEKKKVRLVMRRDKTLKVCANHMISAEMHLQPNIGSDRSWVWKVHADYADEAPTSETLAIRFANSQNAQAFKLAFESAQDINASVPSDAPAASTETPAAEPVESKPEESKEESKEAGETPATEADKKEEEPAAEAEEEKKKEEEKEEEEDV